MISFPYLQQSLLDAQARVLAAQLAVEANALLDHSKCYSRTYLQAWHNWQQVYREWRAIYEEVCFPLTAIGVLYGPTIELFIPKDTIKLPIVKLQEVA